MIFYPSIGSLGRLGNQMFQLAAMKALSFESGKQAYLPPDLEQRHTGNQHSMLSFFKHGCGRRDTAGLPYEQIYKHEFPTHEDITVNREEYLQLDKPIIFLQGYPESELFFKKYKEQIKECFTIIDERSDISEFAKEYVDTLRNTVEKEIVVIHIRRGDLKSLLSDEEWDTYPEYIQQFIDLQFKDKEYHYLFFCGGSITVDGDTTEDMNWCRRVFKDWKNITFCEINNTIRELEVMKQCDHMILTNRSTFSWWGAYLIKNPNKRVVVPRVPYGSQGISRPDIYWASEFIQVDVQHPKSVVSNS